MAIQTCACCGESFTPNPRINNQAFCSSPACQKERRKRWRQTQQRTGEVYLDNKSRAQRAWLDRNPDYWRKYRNNDGGGKKTAINKDQLVSPPSSGLYRIRFVSNTDGAKSDAWIAEITPVCMECPCKENACKDITR